MYTPFMIFSNSIPIFDINFFSPMEEKKEVTTDTEAGEIVSNGVSESSASILQDVVSGWYIVLRTVAIVALLSILVYVGIRMIISSTSKDKAKYKQMLMDWLIGMCLVCVMHYIMIFIVQISQKISGFVSSFCEENIIAFLPQNTTVDIPEKKDEEGNIIQYEEMDKALENNEEAGVPVWSTNLMGYARLIAGGYANGDDEVERSIVIKKIEYTLIYVVMVIYTLVFTIIYLKRVLYMAFLTIISPLVAMTYPLDKLHDGQAQGFNMWLKEYIFNALLQPFHLLLYTILIGSVMNLANKYPVYALVALGFMIPAEKMLKSMFGFEKAQSPATMGAIGMAGTGMLMSGISKLMHGGRKNGAKDEENKDNNNIRFKPENTNALDTYVNSNSNTENNERPQLNSGEENNSSLNERNNPQQAMLDVYDENYGTEEWDPQERDTLARELNSGERIHYTNEEYENILRDSGYNEDEIRDMLKNRNEENPTLEEDNNIENVRNEQPNNISQRLDTNRIQNDNQIKDKPKLRNRISNGIMAVGNKNYHRIAKSHPIRKLRRGVTYGIGAATLGMIGLAAGIASGDLGKTAQYTGTAAHIGGSVGKGIGNKVASAGKGNIETFKQGYYGTEYEDKLRERQIREWQTDPNNIQYLRARDENYRQVLKDVYPEYARYGCYDIKDFYAAYQLEKAGRSRAQAISAYKLAKRTGDITASPDLENKWRTRLETEFGNIEDVKNVTDDQYSRIEEEFKREQEKIEAEYEQQRRTIESNMANQEEEYKKLEQELEKEQRRLEEEYEEQYRELEASSLDDEFEYKQVEEKYKESKGPDKKKYEARYKELYKKMENSKTDKKLKQEKLKQRYEKNQQKLQDKYEEKYKNINTSREEKFEKIKEEKNEKHKKLMEETEAKKVKVKDIPLGFAETALDDVRMFYENKG